MFLEDNYCAWHFSLTRLKVVSKWSTIYIIINGRKPNRQSATSWHFTSKLTCQLADCDIITWPVRKICYVFDLNMHNIIFFGSYRGKLESLINIRQNNEHCPLETCKKDDIVRSNKLNRLLSQPEKNNYLYLYRVWFVGF